MPDLPPDLRRAVERWEDALAKRDREPPPSCILCAAHGFDQCTAFTNVEATFVRHAISVALRTNPEVFDEGQRRVLLAVSERLAQQPTEVEPSFIPNLPEGER